MLAAIRSTGMISDFAVLFTLAIRVSLKSAGYNCQAATIKLAVASCSFGGSTSENS